MVNQGTFSSTPVLTQSIKFCETCLIFRAPRTIHCNTCDCCIHGFDHHCFWLGTCIGDRNFVSFQTFVLTLNIALPLSLVETSRAIKHNASSDSLGLTISCFLGLFAFCLLAVSGISPHPFPNFVYLSMLQTFVLTMILMCFHINLMWKNETTYEKVKNLFARVEYAPNPFHRGNICRNFWARKRQQSRSDSVIHHLMDVTGVKKKAVQVKLSQVMS